MDSDLLHRERYIRLRPMHSTYLKGEARRIRTHMRYIYLWNDSISTPVVKVRRAVRVFAKPSDNSNMRLSWPTCAIKPSGFPVGPPFLPLFPFALISDPIYIVE